MPRRSNRAMYREAKGLPVTLRTGRPVVALCEWEDFNYSAHLPGSGRYDPTQPLWVSRDEPPTACRASLGDERLTVWLPQGARIVIRHGGPLNYPMATRFAHVFGGHERMSLTRIDIGLTEYPTP